MGGRGGRGGRRGREKKILKSSINHLGHSKGHVCHSPPSPLLEKNGLFIVGCVLGTSVPNSCCSITSHPLSDACLSSIFPVFASISAPSNFSYISPDCVSGTTLSPALCFKPSFKYGIPDSFSFEGIEAPRSKNRMFEGTF